MAQEYAVKRELRLMFDRFRIPVPSIGPAIAGDECDYTNPQEQVIRINILAAPPGVNSRWYAAHLFGHYLGDLHETDPELRRLYLESLETFQPSWVCLIR